MSRRHWALVLIVLGSLALARWLLVQVRLDAGGMLFSFAPIDILGVVLLVIGLKLRGAFLPRTTGPPLPPPPPPEPRRPDPAERPTSSD